MKQKCSAISPSQKSWVLVLAAVFTIGGVGLYQFAASPNPDRLTAGEVAVGALVGASSALLGFGLGLLIERGKSVKHSDN